MRLANYVKVNTSYTRSINLERDAEIGSSIRPYVPTRRALQTLNRIAETMNLNDAPRAWSLIGPYGSGKSAFGLFLTQLLGNPEAAGTKNAKLVVKKSDAKLERNVSKLLAQTSGYCCINLTGSPEALSKRLVRAILSGAESFLKKGGSNIKVVKRLRDAVGAETVSSTEIVEILIELQKVVHQKNGAGVLIIIDELGKFLEFEARHRNASDIYLLQAIAELANKPNSVPLHFIVLLHQAFDQYFQGLGEQLKNEWKKVQGRFESVPFLESTEQTLLVLAETLVTNFSSSTIKLKNAQCDRILKVLGDVNALPAVFSTEAGSDLLKRCYPLHPLTLLLLPTLCQKVAQNERTLFTYLGGQEPHGFLDTISRLDISDKEVPWVMPWDIYEYFILNQPGLTTDHATHHRWAEVVTAIERLGDASIEEIRLIKTIGLLNIVGAYGGFKASKEIIALCGEDKSRAYSQALKSLQDKSIVTFRKFSGEFRIWQGSDFDLETAVSAQKEQMANLRFADMLNERVPLQPLVARRYGIETGSLRYFNPVFIDRDNVSNLVAANSPTIYFCLSETVQDEDVFVKEVALFANSLATVSIVDSAASFRESLLEIMALQRVQGSSPELASDPVAQRELKDRLARAVKNERNSILSILEEPTRSKWFWDSAQYKVSNKRALQELLTRVLKKTYSKTPYLHNELINREQPSSSAMSGRRKLLRAMLDMSELENLGIEKSPPEKSIYLSVLKST